MDNQKFFVKRGNGPWQEVDLAGWCSAESQAGFHSKGGYGTPATGGFSSHPKYGEAIQGSTFYSDQHLSYTDPELAKMVRKAYAD